MSFVTNSGLSYYHSKLKALLTKKSDVGHNHEYVKEFKSGTATTGYIKIITLDVTGLKNLNQGITFHLGQRTRGLTRLTVVFNNFSSDETAAISEFSRAGGYIPCYLQKTANGKWSIWVTKAEAYDCIVLYKVDKGAYMDNVKIAYPDEFSASLPSGTTSAAWGETVNHASTAGSVSNSLTIQTNGTTAATFNGGAAKTVNITPSSIGASASSHTHNYAGSRSAGGPTLQMGLYPTTREASANYDLTKTYNSAVTYSLATSSMTTGKPPVDGHILTFGWDTTAGWGAQIAVGDGVTSGGHMYIRGADGNTSTPKTTWASSWNTVLDSSNYGNYAAAKSHTHSYLPLSGGDMTGNIHIAATANTAAGVWIENKTGDKGIAFEIGSGNSNRGLYDETGDKWMVYADKDDKVWLRGTADNAGKWTTPRSITANGLYSFSTTIDGSANATAAISQYHCSSITTEKNNYPWHRIASYESSKAWDDRMLTLLILGAYDNAPWGIATVTLRTQSSAASTSNYAVVNWMLRFGFGENDLVATITVVNNKTCIDVFLKNAATYASKYIQVLSGGERQNGLSRAYSFYNSVETGDTTASDKKASVEVYVSVEDAVKTIRGTTTYTAYQSFDRSRVQTATYAKILTDTNDGKDITASYNKSGMNYSDYTWLTAWNGYELRAVSKTQFAQASHTHSYLPLSGGTMTGSTTIQAAGAVDIGVELKNTTTGKGVAFIVGKETNNRGLFDRSGNTWMIYADKDNKVVMNGTATTAKSVSNSLTVQLNGGSTEGTNKFTFNGSAAKTVNITPSSIGASATSHTHNYLPLTGGSMTGNINISGKDKDTGVIITNSSTSKKVGLTIGNGNNNRGVYDFNGNRWMIYADSDNNVWVNGNAQTASKLATARTITSNGLYTFSATFDGSANVTATLDPYYTTAYTGNTNNYPWHRIAQYSSNVAYSDAMVTLLLSGGYTTSGWGIVRILTRINASTSNVNTSVEWLVRRNFAVDDIYVTNTLVNGVVYFDVFLKALGEYGCQNIQVLSGGQRSGLGRRFTLVASSEVENTTTSDKKTSKEVYTSVANGVQTVRGTSYTKATPGYDAAHIYSANCLNDSNNGTGVTAAYSKSGMNYADYTYLAGWNGYELRAVAKSQFATASHDHTFVTNTEIEAMF